jgi:hypothetical protein
MGEQRGFSSVALELIAEKSYCAEKTHLASSSTNSEHLSDLGMRVLFNFLEYKNLAKMLWQSSDRPLDAQTIRQEIGVGRKLGHECRSEVYFSPSTSHPSSAQSDTDSHTPQPLFKASSF